MANYFKIKTLTHYDDIKKLEEMVNDESIMLTHKTRGVLDIRIISTATSKGIKYDAIIMYEK